MKRILTFFVLVVVASLVTFGQIRSNAMEEQVLTFEKEFTQAIVKNDAQAIGRFLAEDWIIIDRMEGSLTRRDFLAWSNPAF